MSGEMPETGDATLTVLLETQADGMSVAHAAEFTGCYATGATPDEAVARLVSAVPDYFRWLRSHDEYTPTGTAVTQATVADRQVVSSATAGAGVATFASDREPLSDEDLDWYFALLGWALGDLGEHPAASDSYAHVTSMLDSILAALHLAPPTPFESGPQPALDAHAQLVRSLPPEQRAREAEYKGATWTPRKALRWGITHARAHTAS